MPFVQLIAGLVGGAMEPVHLQPMQPAPQTSPWVPILAGAGALVVIAGIAYWALKD